jgi:5'(3')-deoxyribonucleotidase
MGYVDGKRAYLKASEQGAGGVALLLNQHVVFCVPKGLVAAIVVADDVSVKAEHNKAVGCKHHAVTDER